MMKAAAIAGTVLLSSIVVSARDATTTAGPPSPTVQTMPALITSTVVKPRDSDLVRAARLAVASRQHSRSVVINEDYIKKSVGDRVSEPTRPLGPIVESKRAIESGPPPARDDLEDKPKVDRAAVEKKIAVLKLEEARLQAETLEPYGGDLDEDAVLRRLSQVTSELADLQKSLQEVPGKPVSKNR